MIRMKRPIALMVFTLFLSLSACEVVNNTGGGGYIDPYRRAWYDVYGNLCSSYSYPTAGCNFYSNGMKIIANEDPYFSGFNLYYDFWSFTDSFGFWRNYFGYAWLSPTGILYDQFGNALNETDASEQPSADVIASAAELEKSRSIGAGKVLAQKYALAESAGIRIAKTLQDWAVLGRSRARSQGDVADFSKRLYGVEYDRAAKAIRDAAQGSRGSLEILNQDVAAHWGTSPETSRKILTRWYREELESLGVK